MSACPTLDDPAYFDLLADVEAAHWWSAGIWRIAAHWLEQAVRGRRGLRALDVGCGTGLTLARLASLAAVDELVGLDSSARALAHARRSAAPLVRGSADAIPFDRNTFDIVMCCDVLQHLPAGFDHCAAGEMRRILRPGGFALIRSNGRGLTAPKDGAPIPYRMADLCQLVSKAGLRIRRSTYANCLPSLAQEIRGRLPGSRSRSHPAGGGLAIRVPPRGVNRFMATIVAAEALVAGRLNRKLPFGHSTLLLAERVD
jgi:SAM-dependent methyltransferase